MKDEGQKGKATFPKKITHALSQGVISKFIALLTSGGHWTAFQRGSARRKFLGGDRLFADVKHTALGVAREVLWRKLTAKLVIKAVAINVESTGDVLW